ncbi:hypothetical protein T484DRAFT_1875295 [Baffinella frigidus]|nr:hypothetical protein T484DRAFT_1875295 [Cryptophyta sp. CCMP2293]
MAFGSKILPMRGVLPLLLCTFATAFVPHAPAPLDWAKQGRAVAPPGSGSCSMPGRFCVRAAPGVALRGKGFGGLSNPVRSKDPDAKKEERARREKERLAAIEAKEEAAQQLVVEAEAAAAAEEEEEDLLLDADGEWLEVNFDKNLGSGAYGDVYEARIVGGPLNGTRAVAKSAVPFNIYATRRGQVQNSLSTTMTMSRTRGGGFTPKQASHRFLEVEAQINKIVSEECPEIGAEFIGECVKDGKKWVVWKYESKHTLNDLFDRASTYESKHTLKDLFDRACKRNSLAGFAKQLGFEGFVEDDPSSVARELLTICQTLTDAGLTHRDIKPQNIIVHRNKLLLIDFGAAAAMGLDKQIGRS